MPKSINTTPPAWMAQDPSPKLVEHRFHDKTMLVWEGEVALDKIAGWMGNPRTELRRDQFYESYARDPTNEETCELVLGDDDEQSLKIRELAANIHKNGVRVPVVLTHDRRLLDGNRRY